VLDKTFLSKLSKFGRSIGIAVDLDGVDKGILLDVLCIISKTKIIIRIKNN
jgi:hypothetical protein